VHPLAGKPVRESDPGIQNRAICLRSLDRKGRVGHIPASRTIQQIPGPVTALIPRGEADCKSQTLHCFLTQHVRPVRAQVQIVLSILLSKTILPSHSTIARSPMLTTFTFNMISSDFLASTKRAILHFVRVGALIGCGTGSSGLERRKSALQETLYLVPLS
jgi:hypothetical protein